MSNVIMLCKIMLVLSAAALVSCSDETNLREGNSIPSKVSNSSAQPSKEDGLDKSNAQSFVFELSSIKASSDANVELSLKSLEKDEPMRSGEKKSSQIIVPNVAQGLYELSLTSQSKEGSIEHKQIVRVTATMSDKEDKACAAIDAAKQLPKFTNFTTTVAAKPAAGDKLHVVSVYESLGRSCANADKTERMADPKYGGNYGVVHVHVTEKDANLLLASYEPVTWSLSLGEGASIKAITLSGYYPSTIVNVPDNIKTIPNISFVGLDGTPESHQTFVGFLDKRPADYIPTYDETSASWVCSKEISPDVAARELQFKNVTPVTGFAEPESIQSLYYGDRFEVNAHTKGYFGTSVKEAGRCYKNADGSVTRI